jgi:hypothetical protein
MTGLHWLNAVVLAIAVTMAVMMGVVTLLYGLYLDEAPRLRDQWPLLTQSAALFTLLALVAGAAFYGARNERPWRWHAQGVLALLVAGSIYLLWQSLST